jgi:hypothetical protein
MATLNMDWFRDLFSFGRRTDRQTFRTTRDAYEFVQRAYRETGGPTPELRDMFRRYMNHQKTQDELDANRGRAA